jgi:hypothetical protein
MTLNIDFTPQEIAWLNAQAQQQGMPPAEIVKRLIDAQVSAPASPAAIAAQPAPVLDERQRDAIALLDSWIAEGSAADPETKRQAEEELEEFKRNMNANRAATGDHPVYP